MREGPVAWVIRLVARVPASIHAKLLAAFLAMVALLIIVGVAGLQTLGQMNRRAEDLSRLQRKIASYRGLQQDTTRELYSVVTAVLVPDDTTLADALGHLDQFARDLGRLQLLTEDERRLGDQIRQDSDRFIRVVNRVVDLIRSGRIFEAHQLHSKEIQPLAGHLLELTNELANKAEVEMASSLSVNQSAYARSQRVVGGFVVASIALALFLGYIISWSFIGPVQRMHERLRQIASGDFSRQVEIPNRDELGTLAANLNRMNGELRQLYEELEAVSRHKSEFLANMSHELRTPLNAILGYTELMLDDEFGELNEDLRGAIARVLKSGRHLLDLVNEVLDLSKIEAGRLTLVLTDYSIQQVVQAVLTAVHPLAVEKNLSLESTVPLGLPCGRGDERRITQVLLNLVGNAIKFTDAGKVTVKVVTSDGAFVVSISDTGPGISEADQRKIFEEFYQVDSSASRRKGGTGLGLAIAKRIVELHGGRIGVQSNPGTGSTFWVALPTHVDRQVDLQ